MALLVSQQNSIDFMDLKIIIQNIYYHFLLIINLSCTVAY